MAFRPVNRRSLSFEILANNSPGDGDSVFSKSSETIVGGIVNKQRRRRRKSKSRKSSADDSSPMSPFGGYSSSLPPSPVSIFVGGRVPPPLKDSLRKLPVDSSFLSAECRNGDSPKYSSPSLSTYSPDPILSSTCAAGDGSGTGEHFQGGIKYLLAEIFSGSTLRSTTSAGTEQRRERVYNTMFHVPWRCELLIDIGFIVCLDAFLSLFTIMPARIVMFIWQRLLDMAKGRQLQRPYAAELCDFGCSIVMVIGVAILMQADISIIYHWIRGQGIIKLYVVFNVLEIFDKLCQSFGADVLQVLFNSAVSVECCTSERLWKEIARFSFDQCIATFSFFIHSLVIISQAITISAAVNAQNNALLTLLISNNFAEIKSNVFKRMGTDQLHKMVYHDTVERFHIMTHVLFVWAQNVLNAEDSLWLKFFYNAGMVFLCEVMVDVIKHSFLAKFNEVKPAAYSEFLRALCNQTLNSQSHEVHKTLTFVPLAPACVVMRILLPVYTACVPEGPIWWRWPSMLLLGGLTYIALVLLKVVVGLGLQIHAKWYLNRHPWTASHPHFE